MLGREEMRADNVLLVITAVRGGRRTGGQGAGSRQADDTYLLSLLQMGCNLNV